LLQTANAQRRRLIKEAKNGYLVTWADVREATRKVLKARGVLRGGIRMPSTDWLARKVREALPVRARPGKRRISRTKQHEKIRHTQGLRWQIYGKSWWEKEIHAYIDNKKFVLARTFLDKQLLRSTRVHHHLRTPAEGGQPGFVLPKKSRMLLGVPSIDITAAVAKDRIIFWHVNTTPWNGQTAADMYDKLGEALRATWGNKRSFRVVEDGDTKGYQSGLGKKAKARQRIESWMLPPRSPGWMPLDFCLWDEIEGRALKKKVTMTESKDAYLARLRRVALSLPPALVKSCLAKMKSNIDATVASEGATTKSLLD
jgi:hypothetical protein